MATARERIIIAIQAIGGRRAERELEGVADKLEQVDHANAGVARSTAMAGRETQKTKRHFSAAEVAAGGLSQESRRLSREQFILGRMTTQARGEMDKLRESEEKLARSRSRNRGGGGGRGRERNLRDAHPAQRFFRQSGLAGIGNDITRARIDLGFTAISLRALIPLTGAFANNIVNNLGKALGVVESLARGAAGLGAAGAFGLAAFGQAALVTSLAFGDLAQAYGGNEEAVKRLGPAQQRFLLDLERMRPRVEAIRNAMAEPLFGGVRRGFRNARPNVRRIRPIAVGTGRAVGDVAADFGSFLGQRGVGRDFTRVGRTNVRIIRDMGAAGINLADALRNILVPAVPLVRWLSRQIVLGTRMIAVWAEHNRKTGATSRFWRQARRDLTLLWNIARNLAGGVINIFDARDVDGTKTLRNIERITERFERWTSSPRVQRNFVRSIREALPGLVNDLAEAIAKGFISGAASGMKLMVQAAAQGGWGGLIVGFILAWRLGITRLISMGIWAWAGRRMASRIGEGVAEGLARRGVGNAAGEALADSMSRGTGRRFRGVGRLIGASIALGIVGYLGVHLIQMLLDKFSRSQTTNTIFNAAAGTSPAERDPRVMRTREHLARPATRRAIRRWEASHFNVLDRFGTSWSPEEMSILRRENYPGLTPRHRPGAHIGTIRRERDRPVVSVQVNRREIARAVGEEVRRGEDRR